MRKGGKMFFFINQSVAQIVLLSSVLFCVCECGDFDSIYVYDFDKQPFPWHNNWTMITTRKYKTPEYSTTSASTISTSTESPTTEQQQTTMDDQSYGIRSENEKRFEFLLPTTLKTEDSVNISGRLRDSPKTLRLSLVTGYNEIDYNNVAFEIVVTFIEGGDDVVQVYNTVNGTKAVPFERRFGPMFNNSPKFDLDVTIESESEEGFAFDLYTESNGGLIQGLQLKHHLRDVKYLVLSGDCEKVEKLQFDFA